MSLVYALGSLSYWGLRNRKEIGEQGWIVLEDMRCSVE